MAHSNLSKEFRVLSLRVTSPWKLVSLLGPVTWYDCRRRSTCQAESLVYSNSSVRTVSSDPVEMSLLLAALSVANHHFSSTEYKEDELLDVIACCCGLHFQHCLLFQSLFFFLIEKQTDRERRRDILHLLVHVPSGCRG